MKSIIWKIFFPIIGALLIIFSIIISFVGTFVARDVRHQLEKESRLQVDSIYHTVLSFYYSEQAQEAQILEGMETSLSREAIIASELLEWFFEQVQTGEMDRDEAMEQAREAITSLEYGDGGFFYILDRDYRIVAHPSPDFEPGVSLENEKDSSGNPYIKNFLDEAVEKGFSFGEYTFTPPGESETRQEMVYMNFFEPWGWVVGVSIDIDIESELNQIRQNSLKALNLALYTDVPENADSYPFVKDRNDRYIAYIDQSKLGTVSRSVDSVTGESLTEKYFETGYGLIHYNYTRPGSDEPEGKIAYVRTFEEMDWVIVYSVYDDVIIRDVMGIITILIIGGIVTVLISSALILSIIIIIAKRVRTAAHGFEEFASGSGDLTRRLAGENSRDEVGQLTGSFNRFITKLHDIIRELKEIASSSSIIGNSLNDESTSISASLEQIVSNASSIQSSSEKLNSHSDLTGSALNDIFNAVEIVNNQIVEEAASVEESSASIEEMIASVDNIDRISRAREKEVAELTRMAEDSSRQMDGTMQDITRIADSVGSIRDVVSVINGISSRINLLAMNAAIEAAHAGDAGRGFAVVADEVRKLAESTSDNSRQIADSVKGIIEEITQTREKSLQTGQMILRMEEGSRSVSAMITEVIAAISELSTGNRQILEALGNLKESSSSVKESSALVEDKARFAVNAVEEIAGLSRQNHQGVVEIKGALDEISRSVSHISALGEENSQNLNRINDQVGSFKVQGDDDISV